MNGILVYGGTGGIGSATIKLAKESGYEAHTSCVDVRNYSSIRNEWIRKQSEGFDSIVYCAGITELAWNEDLDLEIAKDIYDVNVFGFMRVIKSVLADRVEFAIPRQVNMVVISSDAATRPMRTSLAYCSSKAALTAATRQVARENPDQIRINTIAPGMVEDTGMTRYIDGTVPELRGWSPEFMQGYETSQIPMGRRGDPLEIARVILATLEGPAYQHGSIIEVNGGRS